MSVRVIPYRVIPVESLAELPDGDYGIVGFLGEKIPRQHEGSQPRPSPWSTMVIRISEGRLKSQSSGSKPEEEFVRQEVQEILVVAMPPGKLIELNQRLSQHGIELRAA